MPGSYLLLGSNLGNSRHHLQDALTRLGNHGLVLATSSIYRSAAWGNTSQPDFLNIAIEFQTSLSPEVLLSAIQRVEVAMGRKRVGKWGPRLIDIDILLYDNIVVDKPGLVIPHPEIPNRRFTLVPLCELAPHVSHPLLKRTMRELLDSCQDKLAVWKEEGV